MIRGGSARQVKQAKCLMNEKIVRTQFSSKFSPYYVEYDHVLGFVPASEPLRENDVD